MTKSRTKALIFTTLDPSGLKKIDDSESIYSVNLLYLCVNHATGYINEKDEKKYLIFDDSVDGNKKEVWDGIENKIKAINGGKENDYGKDYVKIKFNSDVDLPLNKSLKFHAMIIIIRSVFEENGKLFPQVFLDDTLYELQKCYSTKKLMFQKELMLIKQVCQKNVCFVIIGILKMLDLRLNHLFVTNVTMY